MDQPLTRQYILLRPAAPGGTGFARLEQHRRRFSVALQITLPGAHMPLRALLLSGSPGTGAVQDLGAFTTDATGRGRLFRENLALGEGLALFHTLVVAEDWPHPALLFHGPLHHCAVPLWQLKEAVCQYLAVPAERPAEADTAKPMQPPPVERTPSVQQLPTLHWPESLRPLQEWFETLPPFAPFNAPGWRFVRVPLSANAPASSCAVGILCRGGDLCAVAYALPGPYAAMPPQELPHARWQEGRHGKGYWVHVQHLLGNYAGHFPGLYTFPPQA